MQLVTLAIIVLFAVGLLYFYFPDSFRGELSVEKNERTNYTEANPMANPWTAPSDWRLNREPNKAEILYGKELLTNTSKYIGFNGIIDKNTNGLNCQNCHLKAGTQPFGNNLLGVAANYPQVRKRSAKSTDIVGRVNGCLTRSLNGHALDSSNREMPLEGDTRFKELKKAYSQGIELRGKTIGIIGFGRIGQEVAKIAIGLGMNVIATDDEVTSAPIILDFFNGQKSTFTIDTIEKDELLKEADFITLHTPDQEDYIITATEFEKMKDGVGIINTARGGILHEVDLVNAIESGKVQYAGLDVFETEPTPAVQLLMNPEISLTPHIGAATKEAQDRIGLELASQIINLLKN